ncbi:MAG: NlpC/P60 family protein [Clostridia bacterium]|nr:NlpC/P60 family protein [Clostridia bacterium]
MNYIIKLRYALVLGAVFSSLFTLHTFANETVFSELTSSYDIIDVMPSKNSNPDIYVTCKASVDMKSDSSNDSRQIRLLPSGYNLTVLGAEYGWVYVQDDEGNTGYVYSSNVKFKNGEKPENIPAVDPLDEKRLEVVDFSKQYIGTPYVWGGTSLTAGVDCSGFVYSIYKNFGITLNRSSRGMYSGNGISVSKSELKPGDLLFFNTSGGGVSHVGMYIGNNQYIHAATVDVKISDLNDSYSQKTYVGAKRILA